MRLLFLHFIKSAEPSYGESRQISPNTGEYDQSSADLKADNPIKNATNLSFIGPSWKLPAAASTKAENKDDARITADKTSFPTNDCNIDEMPEFGREFKCFLRLFVRGELEVFQRSDGQIEFKQKKFQSIGDYLLLILVMMGAVSTLAVGSYYINRCPANWLLPYLVLLIGLMGTIFTFYIISNLRGGYFKNPEKVEIVGKLFYWYLGMALLIEILQFFHMSVSFDVSSENYCNEWFYFYAGFLNMISIASFNILALTKIIQLLWLYLNFTRKNSQRT
ncbi:uncharacterized protein LOC129957474 [Argiope bruennichi]|uniref:uncharacterized protein LOC129957474 n=1 Tax=Argiope bruennichi TaxID=94029 RepID=UPI002495032D|nr:uncharacterized protein LOC129957474 [Argiope bruennichi]